MPEVPVAPPVRARHARDGAASVPIHHDPVTGRMWCEHGAIAETQVWSDQFGVMSGMGPLIIVQRDHVAESINLGHFGVAYTVTDGVAHTAALNGVWLHHLQPAHWAADIMLGRWVD